jgi:hypothetical protein
VRAPISTSKCAYLKRLKCRPGLQQAGLVFCAGAAHAFDAVEISVINKLQVLFSAALVVGNYVSSSSGKVNNIRFNFTCQRRYLSLLISEILLPELSDNVIFANIRIF